MNARRNDAERRGEVARQVEEMLGKSRAFAALPADQQAEIQRNTAAIADALVENRLAQSAGVGDPYAVPLEGDSPFPQMPGGFPGAPGSGGQQPTFTGGAQPGAGELFGPKKIGEFGTGIATGVGQVGQLVRTVNFPAFVAELVQGVFQAVVDASIQQMKAYGELVQSVAMSLNDFRDQNVTPNQARDHLVNKYPNLMQVNIGSSGPRVGVREDVDIDELPDFAGDLGLTQQISDLDDETIEEVLVPAARNELARSRQALLATMLLMGINRIVVTDGKINAKMKFDFRASDSMVTHAQKYDYHNFGTIRTEQRVEEESEETGEKYRQGWLGRSGDSSRWTKAEEQLTETPAIYLTGVEDNVTTAELEAKGKLAGEVSLNFRSETFDLNQLASANEVFQLQRARGAGRGVPAEGESAAAPAQQGAQQQEQTQQQNQAQQQQTA